jgi:hypothetical protein
MRVNNDIKTLVNVYDYLEGFPVSLTSKDIDTLKRLDCQESQNERCLNLIASELLKESRK